MSEEKDLQQLKKEAAERAKQLAKERLAAKRAAEQSEQPSDDAKKDVTEEKTEPPADDIALAKKKAAEAARAKAAELRKQKEAAAEEKVELPADDIALAKKKAAEAARAKAAELRKQKEAAAEEKVEAPADDIALAKKKAAAAAKAKAAALAKQKAKEAAGSETDDELAKQKAIAAAKAKAAAAAKAKAAALAKQQAGADASADSDELAKAKAIAAAKAKAAAAAKAKAAGAETTAPKEEAPSPNQPLLDKYVKVIREHLGEDVLEDAYINRLAKDVPTLVAKKDTYYKIAEFLKYNEQLGFDYLSELHGTDFQTHMEVYVHLYSYKNRQSVALKVKIDRDEPEIDSLVPLWQGANWPECEAYDLLGIRFKGHPNLIRIFLGESWVGYPLRKDYEPYDVEV